MNALRRGLRQLDTFPALLAVLAGALFIGWHIPWDFRPDPICITAPCEGDPVMDEHVFLVAVSVEAETRDGAQRHLIDRLRDLNGQHDAPRVGSWWIAEDDRLDGSDNDVAVFVPHPLSQTEARSILEDCAEWRQPESIGSTPEPGCAHVNVIPAAPNGAPQHTPEV